MEIPTFAEKLKELRQRSYLTVRQLAKKLYVDPSVISVMETGKRRPNKDFIHRAADFFAVDEDYLKFLNLDDQRIKRAVVESPAVPEYIAQEHPNQVRTTRITTNNMDDITYLIFETLFDRLEDDPYEEIFCAHILSKLKHRSPMDERLRAWIDLYETIFVFSHRDKEAYHSRLEELSHSPVLDYDIRLKVQLYAELSRKAQSEGKPDIALKYDLERQKIYTELKDEGNLAKALIDIGRRYESLGMIEESIKYMTEALESRHIGKTTQASVLLHIGITLRRIGKLEQARKHMNNSRSVWRSVGNNRRVGEAELAIADSFFHQWKLKEARMWYNRSSRTLSALLESGTPNFSVLHLLGLVRCGKGRLDLLENRVASAKKTLGEVYEQYKKIDSHHVGKVVCLASQRLGNVYYHMGKYDEAEQYYREALEAVGDEVKLRDKISILVDLCELYYSAQDQDRLMEEIENIPRDIDIDNLHSNKELYPFVARFYCLEGRIHFDYNETQEGSQKYIQACLMALDWHPILFEKEIKELILKQVEKLIKNNKKQQAVELHDRLRAEKQITNRIPEFISQLRKATTSENR